MGLLLIGAITLMLLGTLIGGIIGALSEPDKRLRHGLKALIAIGCATAVWSTFFCHYQPSANWQIFGFPAPVVVLHLESGNWVDFVGGPGYIIDLIVVPSAIALPVTTPLLWRTWRRFRSSQRQREGRCGGCGYDLRMSPDRCPECGALQSEKEQASN